MAKWGQVDFKQLEGLSQRLNRIAKINNQEFIELVAKNLAARLLRKVIRRTPVGQYPGQAKVGGTLRRGWTATTEQEAESGARRSVANYVNSLNIRQGGGFYEITIINPVNYASYVEFGHRTRNHDSWVEGRFMLTISEKQLETESPAVIQKLFVQQLMEVFG